MGAVVRNETSSVPSFDQSGPTAGRDTKWTCLVRQAHGHGSRATSTVRSLGWPFGDERLDWSELRYGSGARWGGKRESASRTYGRHTPSSAVASFAAPSAGGAYRRRTG